MSGTFNDLANSTGIGRRGLESKCGFCGQPPGPMAVPMANGLVHVGCAARSRSRKAAVEPRAPPMAIRELTLTTNNKRDDAAGFVPSGGRALVFVAVVLILAVLLLAHAPSPTSAPATTPGTLCAHGDRGSVSVNGTLGVVVSPSPATGGCL